MPTPRRCILHVGAPKTGSSAIQNSLFFRLRNQGYRYLSGGLPNGWYATEALFEDAPANERFFRAHSRSRKGFASHHKALARQWEKELQAALVRDADLIISAENLWGASDSCLERLHQHLLAHGYEVEVHGYARPWRDWTNSLWGQRLMGYGEFPLQRKDGKGQALSVKQPVERLWRQFGRRKVHIHRFDPAAFPHGCVVRHFAQEIGMADSPGLSLQVNERLTLPAAQLATCFHRWVAGKEAPMEQRPAQMHELRNHLAELPGPKLLFHDDLMAPLVESWAREDDWLEQELGFRLGAGHRSSTTGPGQAIRNEADLLALQPETLDWLAAQVNRSWLGRAERRANGPEEVAAQLRVLASRRHGTLRRRVSERLSRQWIRWRHTS